METETETIWTGLTPHQQEIFKKEAAERLDKPVSELTDADLQDALGDFAQGNFAKGGSLESAKGYFESLDLDKLPLPAATFIKDEILTDTELPALDDNDTYFREVKEIVADKYPDAIKKEAPAPEPVDKKKAIKATIAQYHTLIDLTPDRLKKKHIRESIKQLKTLLSLT